MSKPKREKRNKKLKTSDAFSSAQKVTSVIKPVEKQVIPAKNLQTSSKTIAVTSLSRLNKAVTDANVSGRTDKIVSTFASLALIAGSIWLASSYIPNLYKQTALGGVEEVERQGAVRASSRVDEDKTIANVSKVKLTTNYGDLTVQLFKAETPVTADNFLRLTTEGKYNNVPFTRIVKESSFGVIQGGDFEKKDGTGGVGALTATIDDEQWKVVPTYNNGTLTNTPVFSVLAAYKDFAVLGAGQDGLPQTQVTIPKGFIAMAKSSTPNSASSQFFITLTDTTLPADYTVFGQIVDGVSVLDKIYAEVSPVTTAATDPKDGKPDRTLNLQSAVLVK